MTPRERFWIIVNACWFTSLLTGIVAACKGDGDVALICVAVCVLSIWDMRMLKGFAEIFSDEVDHDR